MYKSLTATKGRSPNPRPFYLGSKSFFELRFSSAFPAVLVVFLFGIFARGEAYKAQPLVGSTSSAIPISHPSPEALNDRLQFTNLLAKQIFVSYLNDGNRWSIESNSANTSLAFSYFVRKKQVMLLLDQWSELLIQRGAEFKSTAEIFREILRQNPYLRDRWWEIWKVDQKKQPDDSQLVFDLGYQRNFLLYWTLKSERLSDPESRSLEILDKISTAMSMARDDLQTGYWCITLFLNSPYSSVRMKAGSLLNGEEVFKWMDRASLFKDFGPFAIPAARALGRMLTPVAEGSVLLMARAAGITLRHGALALLGLYRAWQPISTMKKAVSLSVLIHGGGGYYFRSWSHLGASRAESDRLDQMAQELERQSLKVPGGWGTDPLTDEGGASSLSQKAKDQKSVQEHLQSLLYSNALARDVLNGIGPFHITLHSDLERWAQDRLMDFSDISKTNFSWFFLQREYDEIFKNTSVARTTFPNIVESNTSYLQKEVKKIKDRVALKPLAQFSVDEMRLFLKDVQAFLTPRILFYYHRDSYFFSRKMIGEGGNCQSVAMVYLALLAPLMGPHSPWQLGLHFPPSHVAVVVFNRDENVLFEADSLIEELLTKARFDIFHPHSMLLPVIPNQEMDARFLLHEANQLVAELKGNEFFNSLSQKGFSDLSLDPGTFAFSWKSQLKQLVAQQKAPADIPLVSIVTAGEKLRYEDRRTGETSTSMPPEGYKGNNDSEIHIGKLCRLEGTVTLFVGLRKEALTFGPPSGLNLSVQQFRGTYIDWFGGSSESLASASIIFVVPDEKTKRQVCNLSGMHANFLVWQSLKSEIVTERNELVQLENSLSEIFRNAENQVHSGFVKASKLKVQTKDLFNKLRLTRKAMERLIWDYTGILDTPNFNSLWGAMGLPQKLVAGLSNSTNSWIYRNSRFKSQSQPFVDVDLIADRAFLHFLGFYSKAEGQRSDRSELLHLIFWDNKLKFCGAVSDEPSYLMDVDMDLQDSMNHIAGSVVNGCLGDPLKIEGCFKPNSHSVFNFLFSLNPAANQKRLLVDPKFCISKTGHSLDSAPEELLNLSPQRLLVIKKLGTDLFFHDIWGHKYSPLPTDENIEDLLLHDQEGWDRPWRVQLPKIKAIKCKPKTAPALPLNIQLPAALSQDSCRYFQCVTKPSISSTNPVHLDGPMGTALPECDDPKVAMNFKVNYSLNTDGTTNGDSGLGEVPFENLLVLIMDGAHQGKVGVDDSQAHRISDAVIQHIRENELYYMTYWKTELTNLAEHFENNHPLYLYLEKRGVLDPGSPSGYSTGGIKW